MKKVTPEADLDFWKAAYCAALTGIVTSRSQGYDKGGEAKEYADAAVADLKRKRGEA